MKIERATLREIHMPLVSVFETSFGRTSMRRILLLCLTVDGVEGWGEVTCGEGPFYNSETTDTAAGILRDFALPLVVGETLGHAGEVAERLARIRGHAMAKAAVENAVWDAQAKIAGQPLWQLLGGERRPLPCGVSIGIKGSIEELLETIERERAAGYRRVKVKIKPGWDFEVLERIRNRFPDLPLMADANSAYTLADAAHLRGFDAFGLTMIEQPLWHDDIFLHARLQATLGTPVCLDESIHHARDAAQAIEIGACRVINLKLGRVGGFSSARAVHDVAAQAGIPVWCGGMLESGVGRAHNIAMSTLPNFLLPGDVSASRRYWARDIIDPEVTVAADGTILPPTGPGIGFEVNRDRLRELSVWEWNSAGQGRGGARA